MRRQVRAQDAAKGFLGGAGRRPVVVGEVEVRDAQIKGAQDQGPAVGGTVGRAEIVPEAEGKQRQLEAAASAGAVQRGIGVAGGGRLIGHAGEVGDYDAPSRGIRRSSSAAFLDENAMAFSISSLEDERPTRCY